MTVGDVKAAIKDLPDDMPVFLDDENEIMECLSVMQKGIAVFNYDLDDDIEVEALVLGVA